MNELLNKCNSKKVFRFLAPTFYAQNPFIFTFVTTPQSSKSNQVSGTQLWQKKTKPEKRRHTQKKVTGIR